MKHFVIYHNYVPKVGGIETAVYNLARILKDDYKVTICYTSAESQASIMKYAQVADIIRIYDLNQVIECDVCLLASNHRKPEQIHPKRLLQWVHSDYRKYNLELADNKNVDAFISVSHHAGKVFNELYKHETTTIQNIVDPDFKIPDAKKILRLVTNSRISPEKGFGRMVLFAEGLRDAGIQFVWTVYGDNSHFPAEYQQAKDSFAHIPEVLFVGYKPDVTMGLAFADYLVQLSDFEGCPFSVLEALKVGVPCILTSFDSAPELVEDGVNGYLVPMNMKNIDYKKIATKIPKDFKFTQDGIKEKWMKIIG